MTLTDIIGLIIIIVILGLIIFFSFYKKKDKDKCVGCPYAKSCMSKTNNCEKTKKK